MIASIFISLWFLCAPLARLQTGVQAPSTDLDYAEGRLALEKGDYQKAIASFQIYAQKKPKEFDAHYYLGLSQRGAKQYSEAIAALQRAGKLKDHPPLAQFELGKTWVEMRDYKAAVKQHKWLLKKDQHLAYELRRLFPAEVIKEYRLPPLPAEQNQADLAAAGPVLPMSAELRPTTLYREAARYTQQARDNKVQGTVVLNLVFSKEGKIITVRVVRGLPDGLTESAIEAARKIRFKPALKDGQPVSVRGNVEFNFSLY